MRKIERVTRPVEGKEIERLCEEIEIEGKDPSRANRFPLMRNDRNKKALCVFAKCFSNIFQKNYNCLISATNSVNAFFASPKNIEHFGS